jgi:hypothetical protein
MYQRRDISGAVKKVKPLNMTELCLKIGFFKNRYTQDRNQKIVYNLGIILLYLHNS